MLSHHDRFNLFDQIPLGICILQSDYGVLFWNRCLEEWTKISRDRIEGHSICEFFPHFSQPLYANRLAPIFAGGPPTIFSSQLHKHLIPAALSDGKTRIQHTTVTAIPGDEVNGFYAMLSLQDVTDLTFRVQEYRQMRDRAVAEAEERKRFAEALGESEERFRTSVENMLDCFGIYRAIRNQQGQITDFRVEYVNDAACIDNQMTREYQTGQDICEILPGHIKSGLFDEYCRVVETGQPLIKDNLLYEDEFGQQRLVKAFDIRAAKLGDGFIATWRDITAAKRNEVVRQETEAKLRDSEEHLRCTIELNPQIPWTANSVGEIVGFSDRWLELTGLTSKQAFGEGWAQVPHPDDLPAMKAAWMHSIQTGEPYDIEHQIRLADGSYRWMRSRAYPRRNPQGEIVLWYGTTEDIDDRKQSEKALQQSEDRLRLAVESAQMGTWDYNLSTGALIWDQSCKWMWGLPPHAEIDYDVFLAGLHPDDRDRTDQIVQQALNPDSSGAYDIEFRTIGIADGIERWIAARGQAYFSSTGQPVRFVGTVLDITNRKQAEIDRNRLLEQEQAARAEAERANRVKDEFLAVLSHELRSPLNPILGWTKLMQTRKFNPAKTAEALATIERNAKLQTQLIDDLLDMAKVLRGKLSLESAPVNLSSVIESAIDTVRTAAVSKSILLHSVLPNLVQVFGDATRLQQIVWNLLSNAIKFTPQRGRVEIRLERVDDQAHLIVSDTGRGISPDFLPHIFESFRQEDVSVTRQYGGLGLGLAIVRQLVEAHGGTIMADSLGEGLGATFIVRLPLLNTEVDQQPIDQLPPQDLDLTGIRILVVDDEPDARDLLTVLLFQYGAQALIVTSAAEVMANLESFQPDVLVSDIGMPKVDGYTLIQQIRALPPAKGGQIPAIALTAYARGDDYDRAISSGYQRHITKPLDPEQLVQAVLALVQRQLKSSPSPK
jgi:PAS domain S-box-containing protein